MNTISYELAKQLKDAGFPQEGEDEMSHELDIFIERDGVLCRSWNRIDKQASRVPTLSELIEACKGKIKSFRLFVNFALNEYGIQKELQSFDDVIYYSTPEEAVSNLWLALNKK